MFENKKKNLKSHAVQCTRGKSENNKIKNLTYRQLESNPGLEHNTLARYHWSIIEVCASVRYNVYVCSVLLYTELYICILSHSLAG